MNHSTSNADVRDIVVEETFTHAPETVWKALTTGDVIARWLMEPKGYHVSGR